MFPGCRRQFTLLLLLGATLVSAGVAPGLRTTAIPEEVTVVPREEIAVIVRELCSLKESDANATDLLREVAEAAVPRDMAIGLRFPSTEALCHLESGELAAVLESLMDPSISAVVASLEPGLCSLTPRLAALKRKPFITWSCPQQGEPSEDVITLLPSLTTMAEAVAKVSKRMRWRKVTVVSSESGWWPQFSQSLGHSLRVRDIHARHLVIESDQSDPTEYSRMISRLRSKYPYRAVIVCVPAAELKGVISVLQKATSTTPDGTLRNHTSPTLLLLRFGNPSFKPPPTSDDVTGAALNWTGEVKVLSYEDASTGPLVEDGRSSAAHKNQSSADDGGFYQNITLPFTDISSSVFEAVAAAVAVLQRKRSFPHTLPSTPSPSAPTRKAASAPLPTTLTRMSPQPANYNSTTPLSLPTSDTPPKSVSPRVSPPASVTPQPHNASFPDRPNTSFNSSATPDESPAPPLVFTGYGAQKVTVDGKSGARSVRYVMYKAVNRENHVVWDMVLRQERPGGIFLVSHILHTPGTSPPTSFKPEENGSGEVNVGEDPEVEDSYDEYEEVTANGIIGDPENGGRMCEKGEDCEDDDIWKGATLRAAHIAAIVLGSVLFVIVSILAGAIARKQLLKKRMSKGPYKILLTPSDFVFPPVHDNRRVDAGIETVLCCWLQHLQELGGAPEGLVPSERPEFGLLAGSLASLRPGPLSGAGGKSSSALRGSTGSLRGLVVDTRARYNGDMVQMKELPVQSSFELKNKAMDVLLTLHGLRHENVNPLLGVLTEPPRRPLALVLEWCSRGSLEDVLVQDDIKLDWSFRLSLLTDLVRGMRYLHSSPIKVHGNLTSRNCVIDARWVLKVTDYGLPTFYAAQNLTPPSKNARELLWTAPELLRDESLRRRGSQPGDVYSFGIVMQEVVVRGEPFCMLSLTPEDIIEKVKRPPPLIRPSVSKGAAPPEAINIMRQCWAEAADMRPDFNAVHDLFKKLNHGRKVNFVDTMFQMLEKYSNNLEELIRERTEQLDIEKKKTEQLLNRMLPSSVAEKLKLGKPVDPEEFQEVTIYFSDIVGFTAISAHSTPFQVVDLLNDLYTCFDATINAFNVYKVETIGDAYMVVGGLPVRIPDHADQIATMALHLLHQSGRFRIQHLPLTPLKLRIGLHTGPCCAGVVGLTMPRYCLFGDTVNTASRMESTGAPWRIHLSEATKLKLDEVGGYRIEFRGETDVKGKGPMPTYWLLGKEGFDKPLPTPPHSPVIGLEKVIVPNPEEDIVVNSSHEEDSENAAKLSSKQSSPPPTTSSLDGGALGGAPFSKPRAATTASRLMDGDLSLPYNHYRCLPPGEGSSSHTNAAAASAMLLLRSGNQGAGCRLLKRQFSLDRGDDSVPSNAPERGRLFKQNSAGAAAIASELERIEEVHSIGSSSPPTLPPPTPPTSHRLPLFAQNAHAPYRLRDTLQSASASATYAGSTSVESLLVMPGIRGHGRAACMERTQSTGSAPAATSNSNSLTTPHHESTNLHESADVKG